MRSATVTLRVDGEEGYLLEGASNMAEISRDPLELVRQTLSEHQYPDGFVLFLGTLFAPVQDRDEPGRGFTHKVGDKAATDAAFEKVSLADFRGESPVVLVFFRGEW